MIRNRFILFSFITFSLFMLSCSKYQHLLKSTDNEKKYDMAMKYYGKKDYYRALQLFDQLLPIYRGTEKAEKISYCYAYCYFNQGDYELAAYQFNSYASEYPKNNKAEECTYMSAYCKCLQAPISSLDQSSTREAIKQLQYFVNLYPNSERVAKCNELIDKLRFNLETKAFENARIYFKIEDFNAAITSFRALLKDFPDTRYREEALFYILKSYYKYASNSIDTKKAERFELTLDAYNNFKKFFPESQYSKESNFINKSSLKELTKFKNNNSEKL